MNMDIDFTASDGENIRTSLFGANNVANGTLILMVHGFKGFKDWGFWPFIGEYFADRGFAAVSFNFSHNGVGPSLTDFDELDKFTKNTFTREVRELQELIQAAKDGFFAGAKPSRIVLMGHSRGGGISLATARDNDSVAAVAVWASVASFDRYSDDHKARWRRKGYFEVLNTRTKQMMRLNATLLEDLDSHRDDLLNLELAVSKLVKPLMIAHGEQDVAVSVKEGERLYEAADKSISEYHRIEKTGHTFGAVHPFEGSTSALDKVLKLTGDFFEKNSG